jgi:hypothetical protein
MSNAACVNHADRGAFANCTRCRCPFCEDCCAFLVNDSPWCEPCGNAALEDSKPRWGRAGAFLALAWALVSTLWIVRLVARGYPIPFFYTALVLGYGGSLYAAWNLASPITGAHPPRIERRHARY